MLLPTSHSWTRWQKSLIVLATVIFLGASALGIYTYERYYRGPGEEELIGTWQAVPPLISFI